MQDHIVRICENVPFCVYSVRVVYFTGTHQFQYQKENRQAANHCYCYS